MRRRRCAAGERATGSPLLLTKEMRRRGCQVSFGAINGPSRLCRRVLALYKTPAAFQRSRPPMTPSALVVLVPEADGLVKPFRDRYDPSAANGMPAHITLLSPFKPLDEVDEIVLRDLRQCFSRFAPIRFSLGSIRRFPTEVLYLAPDPDDPFRQLTLAIWEHFPKTPPYGGKWPDIVPHVSVAWLADEQQLDGVTHDFTEAAREKLPIQAIAAQVVLMDVSSGRWEIHATFDLG
jgi:2'-5' RNA ligase superfamily